MRHCGDDVVCKPTYSSMWVAVHVSEGLVSGVKKGGNSMKLLSHDCTEGSDEEGVHCSCLLEECLTRVEGQCFKLVMIFYHQICSVELFL